jgi:hypothetical protein
VFAIPKNRAARRVLRHFPLDLIMLLDYDRRMMNPVLYGSFHGHGTVAEEKPPQRPQVVLVERWDGERWVAIRQIWNEAEQRYQIKEAA